MTLHPARTERTSPRMVDTQLRVYTHPWRSIMATQRRTSTHQSKADAAKLVTEQCYSVAEAARSLGINENPIRNWRRAREAQGDQASPAAASSPPSRRRTAASAPRTSASG